jgi:DNA-binding transcriptional ArsR family regulator
MLDTLITSRTRIKLLLKFFSNSTNAAYLRSLAEEFGESTNSVRVELNRLKEAGLLESEASGNTILYRANTKNPLFLDLRNVVSKYLGFDHIIKEVVARLGDVELAFVSGAYAEGRDNGIIDLVLVGEVNKVKLFEYVERSEKIINRKLRPLVLTPKDFEQMRERLLGMAHIVLWGELNEN